MTTELTALEIQLASEPLLLLGFLHEAGEYDRMGEVFIEEVDFKSASEAGLNVDGLEPLIAGMREGKKTLSHHVTNVLVAHHRDENGGVVVRAKTLTVRLDKSVRVSETTDYVVETERGWRIAKRRVNPIGGYP